MTNKERIEREGYQITFHKRSGKIIAVASKECLHLTAQGNSQPGALAKLRTVVLKTKGGPNGNS